MSHKTTLPCSFVKYAVLSIQPTSMDLTLDAVATFGTDSDAFLKSAQDEADSGIVKKLHDSWNFQNRSLFIELGGNKYPMLELVRST